MPTSKFITAVVICSIIVSECRAFGDGSSRGRIHYAHSELLILAGETAYTCWMKDIVVVSHG